MAIGVAVVVVSTIVPESETAFHPGHVVVAEFENRTGDPSLDLLGSQIGHWITHGLQHEAIPATPWDFAIQSWRYVQSEVEAGRIHDPARGLAEETGAGLVISGAIHRISGDSLELRVNVTDANQGMSLGTIDPLRIPRASDSEIITLSQQRVMAFLVPMLGEQTHDDVSPDALGSPPTREAYAAYRENEILFDEAEGVSEEAVESFRRAAELDSMWAFPLIRMHVALRPFQFAGRRPRFNTGALLASVQTVLEGLLGRLNPYERALVESEPARHNVIEARRLPALRRAAELAPGSAAVWDLAFYLVEHDRPREAIALLLTLDNQRRWVRDSPD